jgi:HSP20 family protein
MRRNSLIPWGSYRYPLRAASDVNTYWQREFDRFFEGFPQLRTLDAGTEMRDFHPRANVLESETEFSISLELPGLDEKDIDLSLEKDVLIISGEKKLEQEKTEGDYYRMERRYGSFKRTFRLPEEVIDYDGIEANFANGVLSIRLPKQEPEAHISKRITVQAG